MPSEALTKTVPPRRNPEKRSRTEETRPARGAAWGLPAILIPLPKAAQDHQRENAYAYARFGAAAVIEETNLTPHLLLAEIDKLLGDSERVKKMKMAAQGFARLDAADKIAKEIIKLGVHE